jgi:mRNA interferase MazF
VPSNIEFKRGDIVRVSLNPTVGSEQSGERPGLILSPDEVNKNLSVVLVAILTSKHIDRVFPNEVLVAPPNGGLPRLSKVMLYLLRTIDKARILGHYGSLNSELMSRVDTALKIATGLTVL